MFENSWFLLGGSFMVVCNVVLKLYPTITTTLWLLGFIYSVKCVCSEGNLMCWVVFPLVMALFLTAEYNSKNIESLCPLHCVLLWLTFETVVNPTIKTIYW